MVLIFFPFSRFDTSIIFKKKENFFLTNSVEKKTIKLKTVFFFFVKAASRQKQILNIQRDNYHQSLYSKFSLKPKAISSCKVVALERCKKICHFQSL
jgi:hypothetical protein